MYRHMVAIRPPTLHLTCISKIEERVTKCKDSADALSLQQIHRALNDISLCFIIRDDPFLRFELVHQIRFMQKV